MILTKDNILRFVREKKYTTPTFIAEAFETTTMIASAALSELAREKLIGITYLKLSSSPYYFDPKQKSALVELGEKHFSGYEKEVFNMLKQNEIVNDNSLSIQLRLAVDKIKDFANLLEIEYEGKNLKFWIWYLRDLDETRKQIMDVLNPKEEKKSTQNKNQKNQQQENNIPQNIQKEAIKEKQANTQTQQKPSSQNNNNQQQNQNSNTNNNQINDIIQKEQKTINTYNQQQDNNYKQNNNSSEEFNIPKPQQNTSENFIENYFSKNYLSIESKSKNEKGISYTTSLKINNIKILFDCFYYYKKPIDSEVIQFYTSSIKPKIIFIEGAPKKLFTLAENLENFTLVNI